MTEKQINIRFHEFRTIEELEDDDRELARAAIEAMGGAYAPYSHFHVGGSRASVKRQDSQRRKSGKRRLSFGPLRRAYRNVLCGSDLPR